MCELKKSVSFDWLGPSSCNSDLDSYTANHSYKFIGSCHTIDNSDCSHTAVSHTADSNIKDQHPADKADWRFSWLLLLTPRSKPSYQDMQWVQACSIDFSYYNFAFHLLD